MNKEGTKTNKHKQNKNNKENKLNYKIQTNKQKSRLKFTKNTNK